MAKHSPIERMRALYEQITYHAHKYHVEDAPEIADDVYDKMYREFNELCDQHPELMKEFELASKPVPIHEPTGVGLKPIALAVAMLSAKKANSVQEVHNFIGSFKPGSGICYEHKIDGLALEAKYVPRDSNRFVLEHIVTRGAGMVGEDVTHALPLFGNPFGIPSSIEWDVEEYGPAPDEFLVRGEAYVDINTFERLNETYDKKKATPRNAVAGWVRALPENQDRTVWGELRFACYWASSRLNCYRYTDLRNKLVCMNLYPPIYVGLEDIVENRRGTSIPIDGIMIKVNAFSEWDRVGVTAKHPNYMLAYKFPNEEGQSPMESVEWNTSRFGRVVPTGKYSPVKVGGVMCKSASLDNYSSFMELGLCVGDIVSITRNNDVIPRINHVIEHADGPLLEAPTECPSCSALLEVVVGPTSSDLVCNNVSGCPAQLTRRCVNLADKFGFDIDGLGPKLLGVLVDVGCIKVPADIFRLPNDAKGRMPEYVWENIKLARYQPLYRFIKALGLPDIGIVLAKRIANAAPNWGDHGSPAIFQSNLETVLTDPRFLMSIKGIASGTAMKVVNAFNDPNFEESFRDLIEIMTLDSRPIPENELRVCITGSLGDNRDQLIEYFANAGIELTEKLTKDCKFLILGDRPGKAKLLKATELTIPTLTAKDYTSIDHLISSIKGN